MTHDERIEAMARAINEKFYGWQWEGTSDFRKDICTELAVTALAAAGVEGMLKDGIRKALRPLELDEDRLTDIVREVMGK